jgi:hypothetical protein
VNLPEKIVEITRSFAEAAVPYAIGGALALAMRQEIAAHLALLLGADEPRVNRL